MTDIHYYSDCVNWPPEDVHASGGLIDMIDAGRQIRRVTFLLNVCPLCRERIEGDLGYAPFDPDSKLRMVDDYHVTYHSSLLHGRRAYYFTHSAIEYVFCDFPQTFTDCTHLQKGSS